MSRYLFPALIFLLSTTIFILSPIWSDNFRPPSASQQDFVHATVNEIINDETQTDNMVPSVRTGKQRLEVLIEEGQYAGEIKQINNSISRLHNVYLNEGDSFILLIRDRTSDILFWPFNHDRIPAILLMTGLLVALVIVIGGWQGAMSLLSLYFTGSLIIGVLIPGLFAAWNPVLLTTVLVALKIVVSFILIAGWTKKSLLSMLGTIAGVCIAGGVAQIFGELANLNGLYLDKGEDILYLGGLHQVDIRWLLFVTIVISALGAVMDVAISMVSSYQELLEANPTQNKQDRFVATMRIGRDILGTMTNTLILAFVGSSLTTMMMIWGLQMPIMQFMNIPAISLAMIHGLAGSIGLTLTIPVTVALCHYFYDAHQLPAAQNKQITTT